MREYVKTKSHQNIPRRNSAAEKDWNPINKRALSTSNTGVVNFSAGNVYYNTNPEGAELINNGQFYTNSGWSVSSAGGFFFNNSLTLNSSQINTEGGETVYSSCTQVGSIFEIGKTYKLVIENLNITSGSIELKFGSSHNTNPQRPILTASNNGTYEYTFIALNQNDGFTINSNSNTVASLNSISIKEVIGKTESVLNKVLIRDEWGNYTDMLRSSNLDDVSAQGSYSNNQTIRDIPYERVGRINGKINKDFEDFSSYTIRR